MRLAAGLRQGTEGGKGGTLGTPLLGIERIDL